MERIDEVAITNHVPLPNQGDRGGWVRGLIQSHSGWQVTVAERTRCNYVRIAFFALAAIGSASLNALNVISRAYRLLPL